jgi:hypothetical protein
MAQILAQKLKNPRQIYSNRIPQCYQEKWRMGQGRVPARILVIPIILIVHQRIRRRLVPIPCVLIIIVIQIVRRRQFGQLFQCKCSYTPVNLAQIQKLVPLDSPRDP